MTDEFTSYPDLPINLDAMLASRIAGKLPPPGTVDPYKLMVQKKRQMDTDDLNPGPVVRWPEEDVQALKDYCARMGIYGFNTKLNPRLVMAQLKQQFGNDYTNVPLEERVPPGYEKIGTKTPYGPNNSYSHTMRQKQILHG
jgi:hypothetical protein